MAKLFDFELVFTQIPSLLQYLPITLELAVLSTLLGFLIGLLIAIIKIRQVKILNKVVTVFVSVIRGTPILVQLYIAYFGIPMLIKYINRKTGASYSVQTIPGIIYAMSALAINQSAFDAEIIRAALLSVNPGQIEAAESLGMTYWQALKRIIIPEAITVALPSLGNAFINAIKGTSLAFTCGVIEMTAQGRILSGRNYRYFEVYVSLAIIYWVLTVIIEQLIKLFERKTSIPEQVELYEPDKASESLSTAVSAEAGEGV